MALVLVGCGEKKAPVAGWGAGSWTYPRRLEDVVPKQFQAGIRHARTVEVGLVHPVYEAPGIPTGEAGWVLRSGWTRLSEPQSREVESLLLERKHWQTMRKKCEFQPGIALRWTSERDTAVALVCLDCFQIVGHWRRTPVVGEFDPSADAWLSWAEASFPGDSTLQAFIVRRREMQRQEEERSRAWRSRPGGNGR